MKKIDKIKSAVAAENRRISKANKEFDKMTPAEKRVQIARDVLAQLASKRLVAASGLWLSGKGAEPLFSNTQLDKNDELQAVLSKKKQCTGCALGGMFMCAVERADKLKLKDLSEDSQEARHIENEDVFEYMGKYFSRDQLNAIEAAFEQGQGASDDYKAGMWLEDIDDASLRMRLIMENIVANKGKFVLSKRPQQVYVTPGFNG